MAKADGITVKVTFSRAAAWVLSGWNPIRQAVMNTIVGGAGIFMAVLVLVIVGAAGGYAITTRRKNVEDDELPDEKPIDEREALARIAEMGRLVLMRQADIVAGGILT